MELTELKNIISLIESSEMNIKNWSALKDRELAIIPTDSQYYKEFEEYIKTKKSGCYDSSKEKSPMYLTSSRTNEFVDMQIKHHEEHIKPFIAKLEALKIKL